MAVLHEKLDLCDLAVAIRQRRLRWYGHVVRAEEKEIHRVRSRTIPGTQRRVRPMTWEECVKQDLEGN